MQMDDTLREVNSQFEDLLYNGRILSKSALGILACACLLMMFYALYKKTKRQWDSAFFVMLSADVFLWAACSLPIDFMHQSDPTVDFLSNLRIIWIILIPAFLCMHVRLQVSYKELKATSIVALLVAPAFLTLLILRDILAPQILAVIPAVDGTQWYRILFYVYAVVVLIRSYLLCLNVFYQMPKHMRRSTKYILLSVSSISILLAFDAMWDNVFSQLLPGSAALDILLPAAAPVAFVVLLYPLYSAMRIMPAEDVIVTSREFVVGGLSTIIFVLGRRMQILDWNMKDWSGNPFPKPLYREPIDVYRKRILEHNSGRVSPDDEDIVTMVVDDQEMHFLMRTREVRNRIKRFGYVMEISEITPVYTMLRYFEEIAHFDQLTKLNNRNAYINYVQNSVTDENMPLLIFVGDVNGLKQLNDVHGHILGDQLLKLVADIIIKAAPETAFTARVGGDEYVMLVPHGTEEIAVKFVQDVISLCSDNHNEIFGAPNISWGYAIMTSTDQSYNELFEKADAMMYMYKKNRTTFSSSGMLPE